MSPLLLCCVVLLLYQNGTRVAAISVAVFSLRLLPTFSLRLTQECWQWRTLWPKRPAAKVS
jgi:hypothetical protein